VVVAVKDFSSPLPQVLALLKAAREVPLEATVYVTAEHLLAVVVLITAALTGVPTVRIPGLVVVVPVIADGYSQEVTSTALVVVPVATSGAVGAVTAVASTNPKSTGAFVQTSVM